MTTTSLEQRVPILDLSPEIRGLWPELMAAIEGVIRSSSFIMGPEVAAFEAEAAKFLGAKHAVGVNSGTDALVISLRALGIGQGDEVITTPLSFFATAESISGVGATPVFVDVNAADFNLDPDLIAASIGPRTRAILPVHLYGRPCDMDSITALAEENGLYVLEDCAQSFGASYHGRRTGTIGDAGAFSFFPSKNLGAFGDGGLIVTDRDDVAEAARMLRAHGAKKKYENEMLGYNSRLDSIQAAILRVKLPYVDTWNEGRRAAAETYHHLLEDLLGVIAPAITAGHVFHQYTIRLLHADRDAVRAAMAEQGVETAVYYPVPQDRLAVYDGKHPPTPVSCELAGQVLSLPIWPSMERATQLKVVAALKRALYTNG